MSKAESSAIYPWTPSSYLLLIVLLAILATILQALNFDQGYILASVISSVVVLYLFEQIQPTTSVRIAVVAGAGMGAMLINLGLFGSNHVAPRILFVAAGAMLWLEILTILRSAWRRRYGSSRPRP